MRPSEIISLLRDCDAIQIPDGNRIVVPQGTQVSITQSLGGTYTVTTDLGYLARIDGRDADALGLERPSEAEGVADPGSDKSLKDQVWDQLGMVYDPEIPASVVELGLIYGCEITPLASGGNMVWIQMTLTAPGCGMGDILKNDIQQRIKSIPGVTQTAVDVVLDPPWNSSMMSEAAKLQLGFF